MTLQDRIQEELKQALRQHDAARATALRSLKAAIRNAEIDQRGELDEPAVLAILSKAAKQRRESIEAYRQGGRMDLVAAEEAELRVIEAYLPRQLGEAEIHTAVEQAIVELGAQGPGDMGRVMKLLTERLRGQADGKAISAVVREALAGLSR